MEYQGCEPCSQHHPNAWESIPGRAFPHGQGLFPVVNVTFPGGHIQMHHLNSSLPYINLILFWLPTAGFPRVFPMDKKPYQRKAAKSKKLQTTTIPLWRVGIYPTTTNTSHEKSLITSHKGRTHAGTNYPKGTEKGTKLFLSPTTLLCLLKEYNSVRLLWDVYETMSQ